MALWQELISSEYDKVWDRFEHKFRFHSSVQEQHWPGISEPKPSITYSISRIYAGDEAEYDVLESDLNLRTLEAFRRCLPRRERLYALDWQHTCYRFNPHLRFDVSDPDNWWVPVLPNGDYYIFLSPDMKLGLFGHPWEQTLCIFGKPLLEAYERGIPLLFDSPVRINGEPV
ncbi:MAG: DUF2716 domain-containing protein [Armatimonadetes bacterium]|nr:DUF2716 domain-containing protein [Armatimonadota bacterium]